MSKSKNWNTRSAAAGSTISVPQQEKAVRNVYCGEFGLAPPKSSEFSDIPSSPDHKITKKRGVGNT